MPKYSAPHGKQTGSKNTKAIGGKQKKTTIVDPWGPIVPNRRVGKTNGIGQSSRARMNTTGGSAARKPTPDPALKSMNYPKNDPWAVYEHPLISWDPHPSQELVLESTARHKVWCAGRRTGKSDLGGHVLLPEAIYTRSVAEEWRKKGKSRIFWIVSDEYATAEKEFRVIWHLCNLLQLPLDKPGSYYDAVGGNMHISLWGGAFQVHAQSAKYPEHLVGEALCGVIMAEAAKAKPSIWHRFIRPMLNDYVGWSLHTSTPLGHNHFYDKFQMGQDKFNPEWQSWRVPSWHNPYVYTDTGREIASGKRPDLTVYDIPPEEFTRDMDVKKLLRIMEGAPGLSSFEIAEEHNLHIHSEVLQLFEELPLELFNQEVGASWTLARGQRSC
jgi:hypothetical protein